MDGNLLCRVATFLRIIVEFEAVDVALISQMDFSRFSEFDMTLVENHTKPLWGSGVRETGGVTILPRTQFSRNFNIPKHNTTSAYHIHLSVDSTRCTHIGMERLGFQCKIV